MSSLIWVTRCGYCKRLAPTWTQLAKHMQRRLNIAEVNCDENRALCQSQDVRGYPTLRYYSGGVKTQYTGAREFDQLKAFAEKAVAPYVFASVLGVSELTDMVKWSARTRHRLSRKNLKAIARVLR